MATTASFGLACALAVTGPSAVMAQNSDNEAGTRGELETIVVTASKRPEPLKDVAIAVSEISTEKLENLGVKGFSDYAGLVPNLNRAGGQAAGQGTVVMRGLYTGSLQTTNTTAFYIGETPFSSSSAYGAGSLVTPDPDLLDVERIEVLKGPQGTLFGASALGGLVRVVPKPPDVDELSGRVQLGANTVAGGGDGYSGQALLNVPVVEGTLGVQVGVFSRREGGFTTNTFTNETDLGETTNEGGVLTALLTPTEDLRFTLRGMTQTIEADGPSLQDNILATGAPVTGERQFSSPHALPTRSKYELIELSGDYDTAWGTLTGAASSSKYEFDAAIDSVGYAQLFRSNGAFCVGRNICAPSDDYYALMLQHRPMEKESAELRFASRRLGAVEFLAGLFYTKEDVVNSASAVGTDAAGVAAPAPFNNIARVDTRGSYEETAVFGNFTYYLTDAFDIGAGVRTAKNEQQYLTVLSGMLGGPGAPNKSEDEPTTYQVTARWRPNDVLSTYARVATGYRPGGPQSSPAAPNPTFDADEVTNYELGVKGSSAGGRLSFDAAVYHIDWKKVQLNGTLNGILFVGNAGEAQINGFEVQGSYSHPSGMSLGGSFGYNDAELKEVGSTTAVAVGAVAGDRLPGSPKISAALYGDYRFGVFRDKEAVLGFTVRHQGSKHAGYSAPIIIDPDYVIPGYTTLDLRAGLQWSRYNVRLGLDNATDQNGITGYRTNRVTPFQNVASTAYLIRPRTFSLSFGAEF